MAKTQLERLIQSYLLDLKSRGASEHTVVNYEKHLKKYVKWLEETERDFTEIEGRDAKEFRNYLISLGLAPKTVNTIVGAVKSFYDFLVEEGIINGHSFIPKRLRVKEPQRKPNFLSDEELEKVLAEIEKLPENPKWLFKTMLATGVRVSEAANLTKEDVVIEDGAVFVHVRMGKGKKERYAPVLDEEVAQKLLELAEKRSPGERLFKITDTTAKLYAYRIKKKTGVDFHTHRLRHTVATRLLRQGVPIDVVQKVLGHADISTTRRYAETMPEAVHRLAVKVNHPRMNSGACDGGSKATVD